MGPLLGSYLTEFILFSQAGAYPLRDFYSYLDITASRGHKCPLLRLLSRRKSTKYLI